MYKVVIHPAAKREIKEAAKWYNGQLEGLGRKFSAEVRKKISLIQTNPKLYSVRYDDNRAAHLEVSPFMIHYSIDNSNNQIVISAVMHTSRKPRKY